MHPRIHVIPVSYLIPFGLLFLSPAVHFLLTIGGILVSSAGLYYFSERLQLAEYFETRHANHVAAAYAGSCADRSCQS